MKQLANIITLSRLFVLPFYVWAILEHNILLQLTLLTYIIISDFADGLASRAIGSTPLGKILDPLIDTIVIGASLFAFSLSNLYIIVPLLIFIIRDFSVMAVMLYANSRGILAKADALGKLKTVSQFALLILLSINHPLWFFVAWLAIFFSIFSALNYLRLLYKLKNTPSHYLLENTNARSFSNPFKLYSYEQFKERHQKFLTQHEMQNNTVFVAGGDGFFHVVLNKPWAKNQRLGFYPMGGGNALQSVFYKPKLFQSVTWRSTHIDTFRVNGQRALFAGVGFDAQIIKSSPRIWPAILGYILGITKSLFYKQKEFTLRLDNNEYYLSGVNIAITKVPDIGYWLRDIPKIDQRDGLIYIIVSKTILNRVMIPIFHACNLTPPGVKMFTAKKIVIESKVVVPVHVAGDLQGNSTKITIEIDEPQEIICAE
jgi:CDP-diacylglycerol---glycerol-3-phosphate 3-phosphatidyltransferase